MLPEEKSSHKSYRLVTLRAVIMISLARHYHWDYRDPVVMGVTNNILLGFKTSYIRGDIYLTPFRGPIICDWIGYRLSGRTY